MEKYGYRFSFGPWNISEGADPFGPPARPAVEFEDKLPVYQALGFDAVQFHDDDAVPGLDELSPAQIRDQARALRRKLSDYGLVTEFVAPRLWEQAITVDGAFTSNDPAARAYAIERTKKTIDIGYEMGTDFMVVWFAREGTYMREAKDPADATHYLLDALDTFLEYRRDLRIAIEPKPNEPMDQSYIPTIGHALALGFRTKHPDRMGVLMESAHAVLAGLDPADEIGFAMAFGKLWGVHLNDQNGLKFDQDRAFGSVDLRRAFNEVRVLDQNRYWEAGMVGVDVKAVRTQPAEIATKHLRNSVQMFLRLVELARSINRQEVDRLVEARDYEELDWLILSHLMGR